MMKNKINSELKKILNLTADDLKKSVIRFGDNKIVLGAIADCKEITRCGYMLPSNCANIIPFIQISPFIKMEIPFGQDKIGWTIYEHKQIMKQFNKTMRYSSLNGMGHMICYKK